MPRPEVVAYRQVPPFEYRGALFEGVDRVWTCLHHHPKPLEARTCGIYAADQQAKGQEVVGWEPPDAF